MKKKIILIVEDESIQVDVLEAKFKHSYELLKASNGVEGLKLALEKHPDLIILDLVMPRMDGFEMLEKLREDSWGKSARVLVLTNLSGREENFADMENLEYIEKPSISLSSLAERVDSMLN